MAFVKSPSTGDSLNFRRVGLIGLALVLLGAGAARADDDDDGKKIISGTLSVEGGATQPRGGGLSAYQYSYLDLESFPDITPGLSLGLEADATAQNAAVPMPPSEPEFEGVKNYIHLECENADADDQGDIYSLELEQAYLHWAEGPLDVKAGLFKPDWGSAQFYRPTDYFYPLQPLQWLTNEPLSSEGLDASCFLLDNLSLEGATRVLEGSATEGVLRFINKMIGLTVVPSAAWLTGRNAFGLELVASLPMMQIRLEGTDWLYADQHTAADWDAGFSTTHEGIKYSCEVLRDATGDILGMFSDSGSQGTYVFLSAEDAFFSQWKASPGLVVPLEGGPFLFWPKLTWDFAPQWQAGFQGQILLGNWKGPLDLYPGRAGVSLAYSL